jgi:hypothetical protein
MPYRVKASIGCALIFLVNFIVYSYTLAPAVGFIDSGELAVVCHTLGIAHPTGYPIYTLLGRLFCLLPFGDTIFRVSLMSLLFTCLVNVLLFLIILKIISDFHEGGRKGKGSSFWAAFVAALIFSFTPTLWSQATSNEVYSLNVLFYGIIILLVLAWRDVKEKSAGDRILYLLIFIFALSFGNHMSAILLLPALLFILISIYGRRISDPGRMSLILAFFLLGLTVYFFLPLRSAQDPVMDWGNPESWSNFKRHVTGWQYQVWMFAQSSGELGKNLSNFISLFFRQFPLYLLPFTLLGIWRLFTHSRKMLIFFLLLFLANLFYGINYSIPDIDPYFLGSFLSNAVFVGVGFYFLFRLIVKLNIRKAVSTFIIVLFILFPFFLARKNYPQADRSRDFLAYDLASNLMRSVKKDAVILTNLWDHYSPWLYLRFIQSKRPDVVCLDTELCRRSWYFDYMRKSYPDFYATSEKEIESFLKEVQPFESRQPFDPDVIERAYINMLNSFLIKNFKTRPLYDDLIAGPKIGKLFSRIPEGMVYSLKDSVKYYPYDFPAFQLRGVLDEGVYKDDRALSNLRKYSFMIDLRIKYLMDLKQESEAEAIFNRHQTLLSKLPR